MGRHYTSESLRIYSLDKFIKRRLSSRQKDQQSDCAPISCHEILDFIPDPIWQVDASGRLTFVNDSFQFLFGQPSSEVSGQYFFDVLPLNDLPTARNRFNQYSQHELPLPVEIITVSETSGAIHHFQTKTAICRTDIGEFVGYVGILRDITDMIDRQASIEYLATHDSLTGLYNRAYFDDYYNRLRLRGKYPFGLVMTDIDKLKIVNDTKGHLEGDELLRRTAKVLKMSFRPEDTISRYGGDEFLILVNDIEKPFSRQVKKRIKLNQAFDNKQNPESPPLGLSVGTYIVRNNRDADTALSKVDRLLYVSKRSPRH